MSIVMPAWVRYGAVAAISGLAIGMAQGWRYGERIATLNEANTGQLKRVSDAALAATQEEQRKRQVAERAMAEADIRTTQEKARAQAEIDSLRRDVAAGRQRLRIAATCPAGSDRVSSTTEASGVGDDAGPRLTDAAERDYFELRRRIAEARAMIEYLQGYAAAVSGGETATSSDR